MTAGYDHGKGHRESPGRVALTPGRLALAAIVLGTAARLAIALYLGLGVDEAYTLANARSLQLSYFDHPPLSFWLVHLTVWFTGSEADAVVRLPFIGLFAVSNGLLYLLAKRLYSAWAGAWTVVLLNLSPIFGVAFGGWILPDGPLLAALLASALCLEGLLKTPPAPTPANRRRRWALALGAGLFLGVACLAKYHGFLFGAGILLFLASSPTHRRWLVRPETWAAGVLAIAVFSPVLVWNAQHDWVSFAFQAGRGAAQSRLRPDHVLLAVLGQALYIGPWIWPPLLAAVFLALRRDGRAAGTWFLFCAGLLPVVVFTVVPLWAGRGLPHWQAPGYLFWLPILGRETARWWIERPRPARWWLGSAGALLALAAVVAVSHAGTGWAARRLPQLFAKGDPALEALDWTDLRTELAARGYLGRGGLFVVATRWIDGGKIDAALHGRLPVVVLTDDPRNFAFQHDLRRFEGWNALIVGRPRPDGDWARLYRPYFSEIEPLEDVCLARAGHCALPLQLFLARGYDGGYPVPYGPAAAPGALSALRKQSEIHVATVRTDRFRDRSGWAIAQ